LPRQAVFVEGIEGELFERCQSIAELERMVEFYSITSPAFIGHNHIIRMLRFLSSFVIVFVLVCQLAVLSSCKKDSNTPSNVNPDLATVSTDSVKGIKFYSATVVSTVLKEGKAAVTGMGIAYGKNPNPTVVADKNVPYASFGVGKFNTYLNSLESGTTYYVRAYATNAVGTAYGNQITFNTNLKSLLNPNLTYGTMSDIEGNSYKTIVIGTQTWMAENLKTTKYRNGDAILTNLSSTDWELSTSGACANYYNNASNNTTYGKLYNWYAVVDSRNLCPVGWHIPSDVEWTTLENYLGGSAIAGGKLKSTSSLWSEPNTGVTNESGFSGLPGGNHRGNGSFDPFFNIRYTGYFWSSSEYSSINSWARVLDYYRDNSGRSNYIKQSGFSVRCIKD
jgi:uncharacterized protein (TIGR02145 family)